MRKNGINRQLMPIEGGVCAPEGFRCGAVCCGFDGMQNDKEDLMLIVADRRCPTACVYSTGAVKGAPIHITKKHVKNGFAQAIIANSGSANVFQENGIKLADSVCKLVERHHGVDKQDVVIASTGKMFKELPLTLFEGGIKALQNGLSATHESSLSVARALMTADAKLKQLSYSFELGAFSCKIGAVFKGSVRVAPNMATVLAFITTDVNISSEMLQYALSATTRDSFNLLDVDGQASPNDMVCIMANGRAGNCRIDCVDTEYKKFVYILGEVLIQICKTIASDGFPRQKALYCKVIGAKSKQISRTVSKTIVSCLGIKESARRGEIDLEDILCSIINTGVNLPTALEISVQSPNGEVVVFEEGKPFAHMEEQVKRIMNADERGIVINFKSGNYASIAYGCDCLHKEKE